MSVLDVLLEGFDDAKHPPGNALPAFHLRNLGGNITRTRQRLARLSPAQESALVLGALLEGR